MVTAYFAKAGKRPKPGSSRNRDQGDRNRDRRNSLKCSHCKRNGHNVADCQKKKREEEEKKSSSSPNANGSKPGSSGSSSNAKANVATMQDKTVHLFHASALCDKTCPSDTIEHAKTMQSDLSNETLSEKWLIDSGASRIMSSHRHWFRQFSPLPKPIKVVLGDNSSIPATGQGRILIRMNTGDGHRNAVLQDILYVPDLSGNLLSVSHFTC